MARIDIIDDYELLCLLEYAGENNKWESVSTICDYIIHNRSVSMCQSLGLPNNEYTRYQPSCEKPGFNGSYHSYKI